MGTEMNDKETLDEAAADLVRIKKDLEALEVRTLLSGEFDHREAVVTIRSGAGGVDAADWAEMLMRMYLRWAERHGDRKSTRLNSSHVASSYAVFCLKITT